MSSGGHERHDRAPRAVLRGTANGLDAGGIGRARRGVGYGEVLGIGEYAQVNHGAGAGGILHMIRLGVGHRLEINAQHAGHRIVQGELRLGERLLRVFSRNDDVKPRGEHIGGVRQPQAGNVAGDLAQGREDVYKRQPPA